MQLPALGILKPLCGSSVFRDLRESPEESLY
jgi:hypothetical protein